MKSPFRYEAYVANMKQDTSEATGFKFDTAEAEAEAEAEEDVEEDDLYE